MRQLVEAGVHFDTRTRRWNPKMQEYIFGDRNGVHILDLAGVPLLTRALEAVTAVVSRVTACCSLAPSVLRASKWLRRLASAWSVLRQLSLVGRRMLTNWKTVSQSISRMRDIEETLGGERAALLSKKNS